MREEVGVVAHGVGAVGVCGQGALVHLLGLVVVFPHIGEEVGVVAHIDGTVGVCGQGALVHLLGLVVVLPHIGEEGSVVAQGVGAVGIGGQGTLVHLLGLVVVLPHMREEDRVVAQGVGAVGVCGQGTLVHLLGLVVILEFFAPPRMRDEYRWVVGRVFRCLGKQDCNFLRVSVFLNQECPEDTCGYSAHDVVTAFDGLIEQHLNVGTELVSGFRINPYRQGNHLRRDQASVGHRTDCSIRQRPVGIISYDVKYFPAPWLQGSQQGHCVIERLGCPHPSCVPTLSGVR